MVKATPIRRAITMVGLLLAGLAVGYVYSQKGTSTATTAAPVVRLDQYVNDYANVIDETQQQRLESALAELEKKTTDQLIVLTIQTTHGRDIYEYGREVFNHGGRTGKGLGQKGKDNGVLIVIAVQDRKYHIFTGQGIEDTLPDLYTDQVAQDYFIPNFKRGDYATGIFQGTAAVANHLAQASGATLALVPETPPMSNRGTGRSPARHSAPTRVHADWGPCFIFVLFVFLAIASSAFRRRRRFGQANWSSGGFWTGVMVDALLNSSIRSSSGGSSWSSSSDGGGFGGGGGGSFGGGGSGGSW